MKQHRDPFLFQALEKYFQRDSVHHYKSTEWQLELPGLQSPISYSTTGGRGTSSLLHGSKGPIPYPNRDLQEKPPSSTTLEQPWSTLAITWVALLSQRWSFLPFRLIQPSRMPRQGLKPELVFIQTKQRTASSDLPVPIHVGMPKARCWDPQLARQSDFKDSCKLSSACTSSSFC